MFQIFYFLFFLCSASISSQSLAEQSAHSEFQLGVQAYQKQDFKQAVESFTKVLDETKRTGAPKSATLLTNLGLAHFKVGNKGFAIAYLRQALSLDPGLSTAQSALAFVLTQASVKEIPHRLETYEALRENLLEPVNIFSYFFLSALFLFAGGWLVLSYLGQRRRAAQQELGAPPLPIFGFVFLAGFVVVMGLSFLKLWDSTQLRGTIVEAKVAVQAAPGENQAVLFELYEGLEVKVRRKQDGWVQVSYPGGMTGWISEKAIL